MKNKAEMQFALTTYLLYGLLPIYWKFLSSVPAFEILAFRILCSSIFLSILLALQTKLSIPNLKTILVCLCTGSLLFINWGTFIYAISTDQALESSLGYFLYPIVNAIFGFYFLKEAYSKIQKLAFIFFITAILYLSIKQNSIPYIAIILASSLSLYGLVRKKYQIEASLGLWLETVILLPFSLIYLYLFKTINSNTDISLIFGLIGTGIITTVPLYFFLKAIKKLSLSLIGILQYLNPTLQFLIAIFIFNEPLNLDKLLAFILIWLGIIIYFTKEILNLYTNKPETIIE